MASSALAPALEKISCPNCGSDDSTPWAKERGYILDRCNGCAFLYVNPRPASSLIAEAVETGIHSALDGHKVVGRRFPSKVRVFRRLIGDMFSDVWAKGKPVSWLDIGAGFGEIVDAVQAVAPAGSDVWGLEPMKPKADAASASGLQFINGYMSEVDRQFDFVSLIHVFSHIPDFKVFLAELKQLLVERGEFLLVTGNIADLKSASEVPTILDLPDHLTFAGERHVVQLLEQAGFEIIDIRRWRADTPVTALKSLVKFLMGKPVKPRLPYTSAYRNLAVRAKLR